jgi:hypothetical protein
MFKVWIEIEEVDDEGDAINQDADYSFPLPFASSAVAETHQEALDIGVRMHNAVNPSCPVDRVTLTEDGQIAD